MPYHDVSNLVTVTDKYDTPNAWWFWNSRNYCCENTAPSLPESLRRGLSCSRSLSQTYAEDSAARKSDYPNSHISLNPESTSITAGAFRSTSECSCRVWEHIPKLQGGLGASERYFKAWVRATIVFGRFVYGFRTNFHSADGDYWILNNKY